MDANTIELLEVELLNSEEFKLVDYWLKVFRMEVGWHYHLDLTWQLKAIKSQELPRGATIIDAGAATGLMQFILASLGYNILSIDFNKQRIPFMYSAIFKTEIENVQDVNNKYISHLNEEYVADKIKSSWSIVSFLKRLTNRLNKKFIYEVIKTLFRPYGKIKFVTADFSRLDFIEDNTIDAIVSTSAIEHNPVIETVSLAIDEFNRVLKKEKAMFITTSATNESTWWHEPSKGHCFSEADLINIFSIPKCVSNFEKYSDISANIKSSNFLQGKIPSFYLNNPNCGMPNGIWDPKYIPVAITKYKE